MSRIIAITAQKAHGIEGQEYSYQGPRSFESNPNNSTARFEVKDGTTAMQIAESIGLASTEMLSESVVQGRANAPHGCGSKTVKITVAQHIGAYEGDPLHGKPVATISTR